MAFGSDRWIEEGGKVEIQEKEFVTGLNLYKRDIIDTSLDTSYHFVVSVAAGVIQCVLRVTRYHCCEVAE